LAPKAWLANKSNNPITKRYLLLIICKIIYAKKASYQAQNRSNRGDLVRHGFTVNGRLVCDGNKRGGKPDLRLVNAGG
jgi:hypothetical protein